MTKLVNRAKMTTATTGTGTITLGSAVDGYQTFAAAGVTDADVVRYVIEDGDAWEIGLGTYSAGALTRGSIESSNADNPINLTGNAVVYVSAAAADLQELVDFADNFVLPTADGATGQVLTTNGAGTLSFTTITGYTNADVDAHLNTSTAASGEVLSWNGSDYDWVAASSVLDSTVVTLTGTQTLTNKTLTDPAIVGTILEDVFTITDGAAFEIDPSNGSVQLITLGASRTPKATNFAAGETITLMVDDGSAFTLTWTDATFGGSGVVWKTDGGTAPTLNTTGYTAIVLWKVGTQVYGARVGDA